MNDAKQVALRLEQTLLERIEAHAERLKRSHPGLTVSRADAMRGLMLDALTVAEAEAQQTAPKAKSTK